ncbi:universal stress protein [Streptomyces sp. NPDC020096]
MAEGTRVVVGVSGSLGSLAALHHGVAEARRRQALLVPVLAWAPVGGEVAYRKAPCPSLLKEWERDARQRLDTAFEQAFGGCPARVVVRPILARSAAGPALVKVADRPDDLLVVGTGRRGRLRRLLHGEVSRYCLARATCTVVAVPPPALLEFLDHATPDFDPMTLLSQPPHTVTGS